MLDQPSLWRLNGAFVQALLNHAPHAPMAIKDRSLRFAFANQAFADIAGIRTPHLVVGCSAREFFPARLWRSQEVLDEMTLRTRRHTPPTPELYLRPDGSICWHITTRWLLLDAQGAVEGVAIQMRPLDGANADRDLCAIADGIRAHPDRTLTAAASAMREAFATTYGVIPQRYRTLMRLTRAVELLRDGCAPAAVARMCGFSSDSAFSRRFRALVGAPPSAFQQASAWA